MYNYGKSIIILYPINPATASTKLPLDKLDAIFMNSANTIVEIAKNPKRKAETGKLNSSGWTTTYFIINNPSLAEGKQTKWRRSTVKNRLTVTSVGLFNVALKDEKTARTTENNIWTPNVKHDLKTKSTYSFSLSLYLSLFDFINAQNVDV